jgi:hypothetical protein
MGHAAQPRPIHLRGTYDGAMMVAVQLEEDAMSDIYQKLRERLDLSHGMHPP